MWTREEATFEGQYYQIRGAINQPKGVQQPHIPLLIAGDGEQVTLKLVAQYADACNFFPTPQLPHKLEVLRAHCRALGRNFDEIEKTAMFNFDVGPNGEKVNQVIGGLRWLAGMGIQTVIGGVPRIDKITPLEIIGEKLIPAVADLQPTTAAAR